MTEPMIPGMHRQSCSDEACGGCYPDPGTPVRFPGPRRDLAGLSEDRRRTVRNRELLDAGIHPATRLPLPVEGTGTCGDCAHHHAYRESPPRVWHKCDLHRLGQSHSAASDIRVSWPACSAWQEEEA